MTDRLEIGDLARKAGDRLKIGDLARKTGKSLRALRLYEERGLLSPARTDGGFRLYGANEVARVYWIAKLQDMGFSLAQIEGLMRTVEATDRAPAAMHNLRELFRGRLSDTQAQVERLVQLQRDLLEALAYLEGCRTCTTDHDIDGCVVCDSVQADATVPTLVAGVHRPHQPGSVAAASLVRPRPAEEA